MAESVGRSHSDSAEAGADIVIAARNAEKTARVVEEFRALGRRAHGVARSLGHAITSRSTRSSPVGIRTDMTAAVEASEVLAKQIRERTPERHFGEAEELAGTGVFLASAASNFVTGQAICVDGGYSIA